MNRAVVFVCVLFATTSAEAGLLERFSYSADLTSGRGQNIAPSSLDVYFYAISLPTGGNPNGPQWKTTVNGVQTIAAAPSDVASFNSLLTQSSPDWLYSWIADNSLSTLGPHFEGAPTGQRFVPVLGPGFFGYTIDGLTNTVTEFTSANNVGSRGDQFQMHIAGYFDLLGPTVPEPSTLLLLIMGACASLPVTMRRR